MKFTPEVVAALKVLRDNAESDFERHRLDVLERDLTEPPAVEVIDKNHQRFNGVTYPQRQKQHFYISRALHREVWEYYNGQIPESCVIHHIDGDKTNNAIENLQCLTGTEHQIVHKMLRATAEKTCQHCGKQFLSKGSSVFCSSLCRQRAAYADKSNWEERICPVCAKTFSCYKYSKQIFCSISCGRFAREQQRKSVKEKILIHCKHCGKELPLSEAHCGQFCSQSCRGFYRQKTQLEERTCSECGKTFSCYKYSKTTFCSRRCANISNGKRKRKS